VTQGQLHLYTAVNWALLLQAAVVGGILVVSWWRAPTVRSLPRRNLPHCQRRAPRRPLAAAHDLGVREVPAHGAVGSAISTFSWQ